MSASQIAQDSPGTPRDSRRKRKAKELSGNAHDAKRIRTQDDAQADGTPAGAKPAKTDSALVVARKKENAVAKTEGGEVVKQKKKQAVDKNAWYTSEPAGGRFLQIDPIFSKDERYILFATAKAVLIYSAVTSLLVRTLPMNYNQSITAYTLSATNPDHLYVSDAAGFVVLWDWVNGQKIQRWNLAAPIRGMATTAFEADGEKVDMIYTLERGEHSIIHAHQLHGRKDEKDSVAQTLLKTRVPLQSFTVADQGQVIAAAAKDRVFLGKAKETTISSPKDLVFVWRELSSNEAVTTIDVQVKHQDSKEKKTPKKSASNPAQVNLTVGCANGMVLVYEDIVHKLIQVEKPKKDSKDSTGPSLAPRHFHWHRNAVGTVKWSLDGNYIISGGQETVLVLWQLQTSKKQFLPHLTSAIDTLVVSPSGTSYCVQLADNSVIVLSTTELLPKTNIAGVQSSFLSFESTVPEKELLDQIRRTAAAINPQNSNQILLAVPASQPKTEANGLQTPAPFLQTYDISSNHHVFRQAITRNNATVFNQGPGAVKLREPDLRHLQLSHDGKWLATVEEWTPPVEDVEHLAAEKLMIEEERRLRREVYLKFWLWNEEKAQWMLETRIDAPHKFSEKPISGRVFDLKFDPSGTSFATVGEDGFVRIWAPKTRLHDGTVVRGSKGEGLVTWSNRNSIRLEAAVEGLDANSDIPSELIPVHARLAYSPDGSVLAASQEFYGNNSQGLVHFIDPLAGSIRYSRGGLYSTGLVDIGFVGRQFIILSNSFSVWDLVDDELSYGYSFRPLGLSRSQKAEMAHLAINQADGTFAISLPLPEAQKKQQQQLQITQQSESEAPAPKQQQQQQLPKKRQSKIFVFGTSSPRPLYSAVVPQIVTALLPAHGSKGFVALNSAAELRVVAPKSAAGLQLVGPVAAPEESLSTFLDQEEETPLAPLVEDEDEEKVEALLPSAEDIEDMADGENDKPVVRPEQLASVFDVGPSFALPPVRDLFEAVVGLYARKPRGVAAV